MTPRFADAVAVAISHLAGALDVPVSGQTPNPRPARFVTVTRTGGPRRNLVTDEAQLSIYAWGTSDPDALALAEEVRGAIGDMAHTIVDEVVIYDVDEMSGPGVLPDESGQPRYRQTFAVATRGV